MTSNQVQGFERFLSGVRDPRKIRAHLHGFYVHLLRNLENEDLSVLEAGAVLLFDQGFIPHATKLFDHVELRRSRAVLEPAMAGHADRLRGLYSLGTSLEQVVRELPKASKYNVSFRNITEGGYNGVITWTVFPSKEDFDAWYDEKMRSWYEVVEEGISEERCIELTSQTPPECYLAAAIQEASDQETGEIDPFILEMELQNAAQALVMRAARAPKE